MSVSVPATYLQRTHAMKALYLQSYPQNEVSKTLLAADQYDAFYSDPLGKYDQLQLCLNSLNDGDTLFIERESCLAGTMPEAVTVLHNLALRGVNVWCDRSKKFIDSSTSPYRFASAELAQAVIDFRNAFSRGRQSIGIAKARLAGKSLGRNKVDLPESFPSVCHDWFNKKITLYQAAGMCEMSVTTFWKRAKEFEEQESTHSLNSLKAAQPA